MKKVTALILALLLAMLFTSSGANAAPEDMRSQTLPDFTVTTISGSTFTLSESLKTHDLVLINFWATWCGPCCREFPCLQEAWAQYSDRVDVIALSIEETDTFDELRRFAGDYGLSFPIGRDENRIFDSMGGTMIPTTMIVDRNRCVVAVEIGSKSSAKEFTDLFDTLLSSSIPRNQAEFRCRLRFCDANGNPVPGVTVAFCNGEYSPVETDGDGSVTFNGNPRDYHVHLLDVPAGFVKPWEELQIMCNEFDLTIMLPQDGMAESWKGYLL